MKKILVFTSTFPSFLEGDATPGFVYDLSKRLAKQGLSITILTPRVPGSKKYEEKEGMKVYRYSYFFSEKLEKLADGAILPNIKQNKLLYFQIPFLIIAAFFALIKIVKKEKIDTIHAHWIIPQGITTVIYKKLVNRKIKIVCTSHGSDINALKGKLGSFLQKFVLKNISHLTVVSNDLKKKCLQLGIAETKTSVIPMGVNSELFSQNNYSQNIKDTYNITGKLLLFVGRLAHEKGIRYLINAIPEVLKHNPDSKLLIIGHGPLEPELKKQVHQLGLDDDVVFVGPIQNNKLLQYYATADIFVSPSLNEGFGIVFVEAILSGCKVIGTKSGGITDIIEEGVTGFLIKETNSQCIEDKIIDALQNNNFDTDKAREIIKNKFSWDIISEQYFRLLNK